MFIFAQINAHSLLPGEISWFVKHYLEDNLHEMSAATKVDI